MKPMIKYRGGKSKEISHIMWHIQRFSGRYVEPFFGGGALFFYLEPRQAIITHSSAEVVLDFIRVLPGVPKANVKSRIVLAPEHAKRLLFALQDNVMKYEKAFGPINLPGAEQPQGGRTATPFGVPEGKA